MLPTAQMDGQGVCEREGRDELHDVGVCGECTVTAKSHGVHFSMIPTSNPEVMIRKQRTRLNRLQIRDELRI